MLLQIQHRFDLAFFSLPRPVSQPGFSKSEQQSRRIGPSGSFDCFLELYTNFARHSLTPLSEAYTVRLNLGIRGCQSGIRGIVFR
jgi:hypothetical protein